MPTWVIDEVGEAFLANLALADVFMAVDARAALALRVVRVYASPFGCAKG